MKAVLISIQPKWCELIASGKKTVEIRKSKPKLETPFKVYIYETRNGGHSCKNCKENAETCYSYAPKGVGCYNGRGKIVGEFVCDRIEEFTPIEKGVSFKRFVALYNACLSLAEIKEYLGRKVGYGWHISDLVIYDKPRELSEFYQVGKSTDFAYYDYCSGCPYHETPVSEYPCNECDGNRKYLYRPPRSWCYVERSENGT